MLAHDKQGRLRGKARGFTLIELLMAFGLMIILLTTIHVIFDAGGKAFSSASARMEIMEMAQAVFQMMERDLTGAMLDNDGRIFRGYGRASNSGTRYGGRKIFGTPAMSSDWMNRCFYLDASSSMRLGFSYSDLLWFRTNSAPEAKGAQAEIIYRLTYPSMGRGNMIYYYGGTLERAYRTDWVASSADPAPTTVMTSSTCLTAATIVPFPPQSYDPTSSDTAMTLIPLCPFCYELRFDFLDSMMWNVRDALALRVRSGYSYPSSYDADASPQLEVWPPYLNGPSYCYSLVSEQMNTGSNLGLTANECRMRLPAAVRVYIRIGDMNQVVWTDVDLNFSSWKRVLDEQKQVDEIGMIFEQLFFLPNHVRYPYAD